MIRLWRCLLVNILSAQGVYTRLTARAARTGTFSPNTTISSVSYSANIRTVTSTYLHETVIEHATSDSQSPLNGGQLEFLSQRAVPLQPAENITATTLLDLPYASPVPVTDTLSDSGSTTTQENASEVSSLVPSLGGGPAVASAPPGSKTARGSSESASLIVGETSSAPTSNAEQQGFQSTLVTVYPGGNPASGQPTTPFLPITLPSSTLSSHSASGTEAGAVSSGFEILPSESGVILPNSKTLHAVSASAVTSTLISFTLSVPSGLEESVAISSGYSPVQSGSSVILSNGQILNSESATLVNSVSISLVPTETFLEAGSQTYVLGVTGGTEPSGHSLAPSGAGVVLPDGHTLAPGSATAINSLSVSLAPSGTVLIVGSQTFAPSGTLALPSGYFLTPDGAGIVLPDDQTLAPGSATVVNGVLISLSPTGTALVVGSQTYTPTTALAALPSEFAFVPGGVLLPNRQTLPPGSATVVDGVSISLAPSETALVIGSSTIPLLPSIPTTISGIPMSLTPTETTILVNRSTIAMPTTTGGGGIGGLICSGIRGCPTNTAGVYTGEGARENAKYALARWLVMLAGLAQAIL